jgi:predicted enzyme related to lactoylglutathione lyase
MSNNKSRATKMKRAVIVILIVATSFGCGFAFKTLTTDGEKPAMKRVTGLGGIFFKCENPKKVREWYRDHLGLITNDYGSAFEWYQGADSTKKGFTQWSPFKQTTKYFEPSTRDFMINYRVADLTGLVEQLREEGVTVLDTIAVYEYGKFAHIMDIEGNKIELWEPDDVAYAKLGESMGSGTTK